MILNKVSLVDENTLPLTLVHLPNPTPSRGDILIRIAACGVCHTELDEIEGRALPSRLPIILGHQVVGVIVELGLGVNDFKVGDRVGVAWIYSACGLCSFCQNGNENLCKNFLATGKDAHGGYAEYMTVAAGFAVLIPSNFDDVHAAPLLCSGAIGYRSLRLTGIKDGQNLGLTGFGASAHLVLQIVRYKYPNTDIFVFARNRDERDFALKLGATWAGNITDKSPKKLNSIIDTTPAWTPVVNALENLEPGGRLVINAIRKEEYDKQALLDIQYPIHLWQEKEIKSVANITRNDVKEFLALASAIPLKPEIQEYKLEEANKALLDLKTKKIKGAKVLRM